MNAGRAWTCPITGQTLPMEYGFENEGRMYLTDSGTVKLLQKFNEDGHSKTIQWMIETGIGAGRILPLKLFNIEESSDEES